MRDYNFVMTEPGHALERNNVSYQSVSRKRGNLHGARFSKAVASFRSDASCTALLLSIMRGANGLNLVTAAQDRIRSVVWELSNLSHRPKRITLSLWSLC